MDGELFDIELDGVLPGSGLRDRGGGTDPSLFDDELIDLLGSSGNSSSMTWPGSAFDGTLILVGLFVLGLTT